MLHVFTVFRDRICYGAAMMNNGYPFLSLMSTCVLVAACASPAPKRNDILNIYDMPRAAQGRTIYVTPIDNDSYYTQPGGYAGCAQISDAPACGGG